MSLSIEKETILDYSGNTLVVANPGTGKTLLLAHKFLRLIKNGEKPEEILCLTFTEKARKEMEDRIVSVLSEARMEIDFSRLMIRTFHSYALEAISETDIVPSNFLRYQIYKYLKDNNILNYSDDYLIETIVPKMETLIRYLKSFGILPNEINLDEVRGNLMEYKGVTKEELEKFASDFIDIFTLYETRKNGKGVDYADMLIRFLSLKDKVRYKYVLIDELQDINKLEADIALESGQTFFAVGDKKQAIFGFQGGSINNFSKFKTETSPFVLSENFRSTNEILQFSKDYFIKNTNDPQHKTDLEDFKNAQKMSGNNPSVYESSSDNRMAALCEQVLRLKACGKKIAIIARTNLQISRIAKELERRNIKFSSTYFSESSNARAHAVNFIRGLLSNDIHDIKNSLFSPFAPVPLQDIMELTKMDESTLSIDMIYDMFPVYYELRSAVKNVEDINEVFKTKMLPLAVIYGKEYLLAVLSMQEAFNQALGLLENKRYDDILSYMRISDPMTDDSDKEGDIVLTSVHKAKGREFDYVLFLPQSNRDVSNFQDYVAKTILKTKGITVDEELDEETFRINFVAFTRAKEQLHIFPDKVPEFLNERSNKESISVSELDSIDTIEKYRRAFNLFINNDFVESKKLLNEKEPWAEEFIKQHFDSLDHISFSALAGNADEYLERRILKVSEYYPAAELGTKVHGVAEAIFRGKNYTTPDDVKPYAENILKVITEIEATYPERICAEYKISVSLEKLTSTGAGLTFKGSIDAIFKNTSTNEYLIIDWKTDKKDDRASEHRQQLETYRRAYAISENIPLEKIKVAIAFIGLKPIVDLGDIRCQLDKKQPVASSFETVLKRVKRMLKWRDDPSTFINELTEEEWSISYAIKQQYESEKNKST